MKREINVFDYAGEICKALPQGILITTKANDKVNTMTIGWGHIGIEWGKPIFVAYVRESRHTKKMLEENPEFTINVPMGTIDKKILGYCGTRSGRDTDKIADMDLHLEQPVSISVPGVRELPLTLECKVIYTQEQDYSAIPEESKARYYPGTPDMHTVYFGLITAAYIIE